MRVANTRRLAAPLFWGAGALCAAATWALVNVYALGNSDHAYGQSGSLVMQLLMVGLLLVPGLAGCVVIQWVRSGTPTPVASFLAGAAFALAMGLFLVALGWLSPGVGESAVPLTAAFLLGALCYAIAPSNVA
jgi:hypothetical protein